ncbi:hypothetical protein NTGM5_270009 [Candidatus Nitrotoga sp. M5]|nr:hypothetical protein NTGM5_270009 [Candidatus Nitrotoga sp. M5]
MFFWMEPSALAILVGFAGGVGSTILYVLAHENSRWWWDACRTLMSLTADTMCIILVACRT